MPDNNDRLDLNADLDKVADSFLKDVEAATKEVKQRKAADIQKDRQNAIKSKDRKVYVIVIAAAVVLLIMIASWLSFGRQSGTPVPAAAPVQQNATINPPINNANAPKAPPRPMPQHQGNNQQSDQQPYDDMPGQ